MANSQHDPVVTQLERQKLTLISSLGSVAEQMRHCANVADQFAQMLTQTSIGTNLSIPVYAGSKRPGMEEEDIEGAVKKRRTTVRKNDLRQELRKQHPDISSTDIMARVKKQWTEMTPEQKAPYERLQTEAKQKWETEKRAYDERRGIVAAPTKAVSRKTVAATIEKPVQPVSVGLPGTTLAQKTTESSDSSSDTNSSDKFSGEGDGTAGDSAEEDDEDKDEELPAPSPPPSKGKAKRKAEIATATTTRPKGKVSSLAGALPARQEKKKRSSKV